jgi:hypothetical protein
MAMQSNTGAEQSAGNGLKLLLAWGFLGIPLLWGLWRTVQSSLPLFH